MQASFSFPIQLYTIARSYLCANHGIVTRVTSNRSIILKLSGLLLSYNREE
jgi:hypothetical protein